MADADVRIRMGITAADLSGLDALTTKSESLRKAISSLSSDVAAADRRMAAVPQTPTTVARPGAATPAPAFAPMQAARTEPARITLPGPIPASAPTARLSQMTQADVFRQAIQTPEVRRAAGAFRQAQAFPTDPRAEREPRPAPAPMPRVGQMTQDDAAAQLQHVTSTAQIQDIKASQSEVDRLLETVKTKQTDLDRKLESLKSQDSARQREATITGEPLVPRPTPLAGAPGVPPTPAPVLQEMRASRTEQTQESAREHEQASRERRQDTLQGTPEVERPRAVAEAPPVPLVSQQVAVGQQVRVAAQAQRHIEASVPPMEQRVAPTTTLPIDLSAATQRFTQPDQLPNAPTTQRRVPVPQQPRTMAQRLAQISQNLGRGVVPALPSAPTPTTQPTQLQRVAQQLPLPAGGMRQFLAQPPGGPPSPPIAPSPGGPPPGGGAVPVGGIPPPPPLGGGGGGAARGAAGFLGRALIGGGAGAIIGAGIGIIAAPAISQLTSSLERYEHRVRSVGQLTQQMGTGYSAINTTLDEMREKYKYLAPESLETMSGLLESGQPLPGQLKESTEAALGFARAYGVAAGAAGKLQGQMERTFAKPAVGKFPLADMYLQQTQRSYAGMSAEQFTNQAVQIGGIGGYNAPTPSTAFGARWTDFISGMGQRFVGQNAAFAQEFAANLAPGAGGPQTDALRHRALARLAETKPGGKLTIGAGKDAEVLDLRNSFQDRLIAMEQAATSPEIWEAFAEEGERLGRNAVEQEELARQTLAPNMPRLTVRRLLRARREQGPEGFRKLLAQVSPPPPGMPGAPETLGDVAVPSNIAGIEKVYEQMLKTGAKLDEQLEQAGKKLLDFKLAGQEVLIDAYSLVEKMVNGARQSDADVHAILGILEDARNRYPEYAAPRSTPIDPAPQVQSTPATQSQSPTTPVKSK